jgi:NADH-quinone oxidoreductase subunit L
LLEGALPEESAHLLHHGEFNWAIAIGSSALAVAGIVLAYAVYEARAINAESLRAAFGPVHTLVSRKYYIDELYEDVIVRRGLYRTLTAAGQWFDTNIVDGAVNGSATATRRAGEALKWVQSGSVQAYGTVGFAGLLVAAFLMLVLVER